jgi:hypothetical protein
MKSETRRKLDWLTWKERSRIAFVIALGLATLGSLYACAYWPDPIVETRIVAGVLTDMWRPDSKWAAGAIVFRISLDDGRVVTIQGRLPHIPLLGPAEIEEQRHQSGRLTFRWIRSKPD